jgi:hypothetical protein
MKWLIINHYGDQFETTGHNILQAIKNVEISSHVKPENIIQIIQLPNF